MTNIPKTAGSSVSRTDNAAEEADWSPRAHPFWTLCGILALVLAAVVFAIDQGTKYLVVTQMQLGERVTVIDGLLWWYSIRNSGAAFSMGENVTWTFTLVAVAAAAVVYCTCCAAPAPCPGPSRWVACSAVSAATFSTVSSVSPASVPATWSILFPYRTSRFSILQTPQSVCAWRSSCC